MNHVNIYMMDVGEFVIPDDVMVQAEALNAGKRLQDMRTKGFKFVEAWAKEVRAQFICANGEMAELP